MNAPALGSHFGLAMVFSSVAQAKEASPRLQRPFKRLVLSARNRLKGSPILVTTLDLLYQQRSDPVELRPGDIAKEGAIHGSVDRLAGPLPWRHCRVDARCRPIGPSGEQPNQRPGLRRRPIRPGGLRPSGQSRSRADPNHMNTNRGSGNREAPRYRNPPPERDYGPPPPRESAVPPPRDRAPPNRDYGPPPERDYGPPPGREIRSAADTARLPALAIRRDYRPPNERDYGAAARP